MHGAVPSPLQLVVAGIAAILVCGVACTNQASPAPVAEPPLPTEFPNHDPGVGYVGRKECRECHRENHSTFRHTGMGRSFAPMRPAHAVEDFTENNELVVSSSGLRYEMVERDGRFYQIQYLLDSRGRRIAVEEHELVYEVGSNNHGRGYITVQGGALFQTPVCWDPTYTKWILCPGFEYANTHFSREIGPTCVFCHNGRMEQVEGGRNLYRDPIPAGIGCERCHGPGQLHVEQRRLAAERNERFTGPPDITNPRKLPLEERLQVCFQCHLGDSSATERVLRYGRSLEDFRPGQNLGDTIVPFRYVHPTQYDFGIASQADRMIRSRCYLESDGHLECLTCHNPHKTIYAEDRPPDYFRSRCVACHGEEECMGPPDERAATGQDDCVACHMRRGEAVDRRYASFTDHWIRRDVRFDTRDKRENFALEPIFAETFAAFPAGEQAFYRGRANFLRAREAPVAARELLWSHAEEYFREAIEEGFDVEEAWFFLGKTYMFIGRWPEAANAFRQALNRDPQYHDAEFALGQSMTGVGDFVAARRIFAGMLSRYPDDHMALAEYGRCLWTLREFDSAIGAYRRAIGIAPWDASLHLNLGMALASVGRFADAAEAGLEAARRDPDSLEVWRFCENAMRAAGQSGPAMEARRQVELLGGQSGP